MNQILVREQCVILENGSLTLNSLQCLSRTNTLVSIPQSSLPSDFFYHSATIFLELNEWIWNHNTPCIRVPLASSLLTLFPVSSFYSKSREGAHRPFVFSLQWLLLYISILNKCHFVFQNVYFYDVYIKHARDLQQLYKHHFIWWVNRVSNLLKTELLCSFTL